MMVWRRGYPGLVLLFGLLISGCSQLPHRATDSEAQAWLKPGVRISLPAPSVSPPLNQQQLLTGTVNGKQHSLQVILYADQDKIRLAGLSPLGIRLFLLSYDADGIHSQQALILPELPPAGQVLADVMLSHWPVSAWQAHLPPGWRLTDSGNQRELRDPQGNLIVKIDYLLRRGQRMPVALTHFAFHYHIAIHYSGH